MQIGLLVMGALGATSAGGVYSYYRDRACEQRDPQTPADQNCRHTVWSSSGRGYGHTIFGFSSNAAAPASASASGPGATQRGGFGSFGAHIGSGHGGE